jgi:hypothetical protein
MMNRITIHLDNMTDAKLKQWCDSTASTRNEAIKALIHVTRHDPYTSGRATNYLRGLHPAHPPWVMNAITVDLDNQTDVDLTNWSAHDGVDPGKAIDAMVHVMLYDDTIGEKVRSRLLGPSLTAADPVDPEPVKKPEPGGFSLF